MSRPLKLAHDLLALALLGGAIVHLAVLPNVDRATFLFFLPPMIAGLVLLANRADPFLLAACRLFLDLIAIAVTFAELTVFLFLPVPKPQFLGMPLAADRILTFYFLAYALFLWIICPGYVLVTWQRHWLKERPKRVSGTAFLFTAWTAWLGSMLTLFVVCVLARHKFL